MTQQLIVYLIGVVAAVYIVRRVIIMIVQTRTRHRRRESGCTNCAGCSCKNKKI